jgi:hypothetical protein
MAPEATYLVVVIEVNPATQPFNGMPPLLAVPHHNGATLGVVLLQAHLHDGGLARDTKLLVDLMFNRQAVGVPAEPTLHVETLHRPVSGDNILDSGSEEMAIMREAGRERRTVVESVVGVSFRELDLIEKMSMGHPWYRLAV